MSKPVCLVTGVGPAKGTGAEVTKRFSTGGYQVAMLARNKDNLAGLEQSIARNHSVSLRCWGP